jgi:hypothetical protein
MNLKEYLSEEAGVNVSIQFYDEFDENTNKIKKMAEYNQGHKRKKFELKDIEKNVPSGVVRLMRKAILKNTGVNLENLKNFQKYAGQNFKYKDGEYDISFTITGSGDKKRGTSNFDKNEIEKSKKGVKSQGEKSKENYEKRKNNKVDVVKMSKELKDELKKKRDKKNNVLSREISRARARSGE